jgi:hypothetical protein
VHWFRLAQSAALPVRPDHEARSSHELLVYAIRAVEVDPGRVTGMVHSANGKVGGTLNEAAGRPAEEIYVAMTHCLSDWEHRWLLDVPDFRLWLAEKSRAIEQRGPQRRR